MRHELPGPYLRLLAFLGGSRRTTSCRQPGEGEVGASRRGSERSHLSLMLADAIHDAYSSGLASNTLLSLMLF